MFYRCIDLKTLTSSIHSRDMNEDPKRKIRVIWGDWITESHRQCHHLMERINCVYMDTWCSWHSRASAPWDTPVHQSWRVASQQPWPIDPVDYCIGGMMQMCVYQVSILEYKISLFCLVPCGRLSWLCVSFWAHVNLDRWSYARVAAVTCWDMGWVSAKHGGGRCD